MEIEKDKRNFYGKNGQVIVEFTITMIVVLFMIWSTVMIFRWVGLDLAERRRAHDFWLRTSIDEDWGQTTCTWNVNGITCGQQSDFDESPLKQIDPYFHEPLSMNAIWGDW